MARLLYHTVPALLTTTLWNYVRSIGLGKSTDIQGFHFSIFASTWISPLSGFSLMISTFSLGRM